MGKDKRQLLAELRQKKHSCTLEEAEAALRAWGFKQGRAKGHARVWNHGSITLTLHKPHGKHMDPGAVATVIRGIERVPQQEDANAN